MVFASALAVYSLSRKLRALRQTPGRCMAPPCTDFHTDPPWDISWPRASRFRTIGRPLWSPPARDPWACQVGSFGSCRPVAKMNWSHTCTLYICMYLFRTLNRSKGFLIVYNKKSYRGSGVLNITYYGKTLTPVNSEYLDRATVLF